MSEQPGLRERKKQRTYREISDAAIALFLADGFDKVSVEQVASAAGVSKPTLFRYFPAKEDLALHRLADHEDEAARVVRERLTDQSPLDALHHHFLDRLHARDPVTGLNDDPQVLAFHSLLYGTPRLVARLYEYTMRAESALTQALDENGAIASRLAAGQIVAVQRVLALENWRRVSAGEAADAMVSDAVASADLAFGQLRQGLTALS
ncbi:TetR/AcrR family transcriptional regulator [Kineosporia babensis]|uniref:TetR/AcrR family transcriptional regulator n=1 Tax=Kineosporia babensis TaxID=499548 RepID=A0A9X1SWS7_9ACTN|nr:TetR/AcrR family transcriptional regulator [Kineosporia babensis]MCD5315069.1 TetR/AcrR family transcriptional regulator [Kineosporia babensis]